MRDSLWDDHQGAGGKALLATEMQGGKLRKKSVLGSRWSFPRYLGVAGVVAVVEACRKLHEWKGR